MRTPEEIQARINDLTSKMPSASAFVYEKYKNKVEELCWAAGIKCYIPPRKFASKIIKNSMV